MTTKTTIYILAAVVALLVFLAIFLLVILCCKRSNTNRTSNPAVPENEYDDVLPNTNQGEQARITSTKADITPPTYVNAGDDMELRPVYQYVEPVQKLPSAAAYANIDPSYLPMSTYPVYQPPTGTASTASTADRGPHHNQNYGMDYSYAARDQNDDYYRVQFPGQQGGYEVKMATNFCNQ